MKNVYFIIGAIVLAVLLYLFYRHNQSRKSSSTEAAEKALIEKEAANMSLEEVELIIGTAVPPEAGSVNWEPSTTYQTRY